MKDNFLKVKIDRVVNYLIKSNSLDECKNEIEKIFEILFGNFNIEWKKVNQKFDFSFSVNDKYSKAIRFSYNNFGEKKQFNQKFFEILRIFGNEYNLKKLDEILEKLECSKAPFQTTFGLEWLADDKLPRIKIYFEEIHQVYSITERVEMLKKITDIIGYNYSELEVKEENEIGAICIDFLPQKKFNLKIYYKSDQIDNDLIKKCLNNKKLEEVVKSFLKNLALENNCFYYSTTRYNLGKLNSIKVYKIYEVMKIENFSLAYKEIFSLLRKVEYTEAKRHFLNFVKYIRDNDLFLYPVISSVNISKDNKIRYDFYLSIKHN